MTSGRIALPVVALLLASATGGAQESAAVFDAPVVVWGNQYTSIVRVPDLDGDGFADALGASTTLPPGQLIVTGWRNDGTGGFDSIWNVSIPFAGYLYATRLEVGDFDLDGKEDFVVATGDTLRYYVSNGIAAPTLWATVVETQPIGHLVTADFDGDGRTDLAVITQLLYTKLLKVILTQASGPATPGMAAVLPLSSYDRLFVAQVEADGLPDLGVAFEGGPNAVWLFPISGGVPGSPLPFGMTFGTMLPASGDIDGDGDSDVVVFKPYGASTPQYFVLRRTGASTFALQGPFTGGPATDLADVDGDGDLDGVCCGGGGSGGGPNYPSDFEVAINEAGSFSLAFPIHGLGAIRLAGALDVDADGDTDLVAGQCVYYAKGPITNPAPAVVNMNSVPEDHMVADGDRDGDPDLLFGYGSQLRNAADGALASAPPLAPSPPAGTWFIGPGWTGDFDGDGAPDVILEHFDPSSGFVGMKFLRNNGGGGLVDGGYAAALGVDMRVVSAAIPFTASTAPLWAFPADADGDGDCDLLVRVQVGATLGSKIWWNDGTGSFTGGPEIVGTYAKAVANLDANPLPDLLGVAVVAGVSRLVLHRGLAGGAFGPAEAGPGLVMGAQDRCALADLDGDGDLDVAGTDGLVPTFRANDGDGSFSTVATLSPTIPFGFRRVFVEDLDQDGAFDVVVYATGTGGSVTSAVYRGTGAPFSFGPPASQVVTPSTLADVDGDGDLDAVGRNPFWMRLEVILNRAFSGPGAGLRRQYGTGLAGSGGMIPTAGGAGPFRPGILCETRVTGGLGGSVGIYAFGNQAANVSIVGGTLLTNAQVLLPVVLGGTPGAPGEGIATVPWIAPPSLAGYSFYKQFGILDPGAPQGISLSNGLLVTIGQ